MIQLQRSSLLLIVILAFLLGIAGGESSQAGRPAGGFQSQAPPEQNQVNAQALAEASQLSRTVVKLFNEKKYNEALPLAKRALELREGTLAPDHELVQGALLNLAETYSALNKAGEALKLFDRLLKTEEAKFGPEDAGLALLLDKIALVEFQRRDFDKVEAAFRRALAIREKAYGSNSAEVAQTLFSLGELFRYRGKLDKAQEFYEQAALLQVRLKLPDAAKSKDRFTCMVYEGQSQNRSQVFKDFAEKLGDDFKPTGNGEVLNGKALSLPKPSYPPEARRAGAEGVVVIRVKIDELGRVIEAVDMCGGDPLLVQPALESARHARFTPTKLSGQPVQVSGVISYNFVRR
jgi:TonB family protein